MKRSLFLVLLFAGILFTSYCQAQSGYIYTCVGNGTSGFAGDGGPATAAELNNPTDVFKDAAGNLYIADRDNNRVRKVSTTGIITTIAGIGTAGYTGDGGAATAAKLRRPNGVCVDATGNVYIADENNQVIRKINTAGIITTIVGNGTSGFLGDGGSALTAELSDPEAVAVDNAGNIYIADNNNSRIRKVSGGIITTIAGGGATSFTTDGTPATAALLCNMRDVSVDNSGNVYFTNQGCFHILRITAGLLYDVAGAVTASYTGDCGPADSADIAGPYGVYPDNLGNVYICPRGNTRVRKVNTLNYITTVVGNGTAGYTGDGGPSINATVSSTITGIFADQLNNVYFADAGNNVIRNFTSSDYSDTLTIPICAGGTDTLHDTTGYGVWTSSNTGIASVGSASGIVTGVTSGTSIITFTNLACPELFLVSITEPIIAGAAVCVGGNVTLSDTSSSGGVWTSGSTAIATVGSSTGAVHGVSPGTVVITYTLGQCYSIATVTVNSQPSAIMGTGALLCAGSTISLSDTAGGGIWSSTNTLIATIGSTSGVLLGVAPGTTTISYVVAGSCYATAVATVNTQPVAITNNTPICQGSTLTLSDATGGGTWTSSNTTIGTVGSITGTVYGAGVGTAVITYGISSCYATAIVTINTQPLAIVLTSGGASMCNGSSIALTDATAGGTWSSTNTAIATVGTNGTVTGVGVGTSTIIYIIGSCSVSQVVTVNTQPTAINGNAPICQTFSITLTDAITGGTWSSSNTSVATVTGGVVTGGGVGTAVITYTIGSCYVTAIITVNLQPAAITVTGGGSASMCAGSSISLTDATSGVGWSSSSGSVATVGTDGTVTGLTNGTSTIICGTLTCSVSLVVTVNPQPVPITGNTTPICTGSTIALTDVTGGGVWSSVTTTVGTVSTTGVLTGMGVGTTVISYTIGTCVATTIVSVNLQPTPILGNPEICQGSYALTDATGGGMWSSSNTSVASVGTAGVGGDVYGASVGTAYVTYSLGFTIGTGSCIVTQEVTVNPQPTSINGNTGAICQTLTLSLSDAVTGGTWSSSNTATGTVSASGIVTGIGVGTTMITYAIGSCYVTTIVTVNLQPTTILGIPTVCAGSSTILSDLTAGGTWSSSSTLAGVIGGTVTGNVVGTATISYTIGSCFVTQDVTVNTQPAAITGNTGPICQTFTLPLTDATSGGLWSSATTATGTVSTTGVVTGMGAGTTIISYAIGSCAVTTIVTVDTQPAAISGILSVCVGLTTSLSDATGGGTWSSVNTTIGTISNTGIVTGILSGTTTISYTLGICAAKAIVTVDPLPVAISGTKIVCSGSTTSLSDLTGGGTWTSSNTAVATVGSNTGIVTGQTVAVTSTATITYTIGTGCIVTAIVTVNPLPAIISGITHVCLGATVTLSDAGGGTWTSANTLIATIGSTTGIVTGVGVGVTTITYKIATGCYVTAPMTVNPLPVAITGPTLVCVGSTITLSDLTGGGTWSSSNTLLATAGSTTGVITGVSSGVVTITYTLGTGCTAIYAVTVNTSTAIITPVGDTTFCPGGFVALTANTGAGLTYQWYVGGVAITGALSSSYIATTGGSYQVKVTNANGCSAFSIPMLVTVATPVASITAVGSTTICAGTSITLDANIGIGLSYQWLLGGVAISGAVGATLTTNIAGDYSVVVTNSTGCSATSNIITVDTISSPTANLSLSGPLTFCQGDSVVMSTDIGVGYAYQWYNASGAITGATGQTFAANTTGTYYVIVTNTNGCTATSIIISVVANALPNVAITASGSTIFCAGGSVTLSATAGYVYQWYDNGTAIAGATKSSYLVTASGGYEVQVTNTVTGCTARTLADTNVTVVSTPVIVPVTPASFCWGGSALLSTSLSGTTGIVTYQWYFNGVAIPGATGPTYNASTPGNYSCQITIPGSCTVVTLAIPVTEYPLPNPIVSFDGTYFQTGTYYVTYQWYKNLVPISGATTSSTPCMGSGDYKVAVTDTNGCQSYSDVFVDTSCTVTGGGTTGITNVNKTAISIFPNPATSELTIRMDAGAYTSFTITNNVGQEMLIDQPLTHTTTQVNVAILPAGIYYITFRGNNGTNVQKFVKM